MFLLLPKINFERHLFSLLDVSADEQFKVQIVEIEYILRNKNHDLDKTINYTLGSNILIYKEYNYTEYKKVSPTEERLYFKETSLNGQKSHPSFVGKYLIIYSIAGMSHDCKTNLSQKVVNAINLDGICEEIILK